MTKQKAKEQSEDLEKRRLERAKHEFVACSRCSFFFTGYDLIHHDLEQAIVESRGKWIELSWDSEIRVLLNKSYGVSIRKDDEAFEGLCKDCRRIFVIRDLDKKPEEVEFRVKFNLPRK